MIGVPILFLFVILLSGLLGELVARFCSEPANHFLRERWGEGANRLGSVIEPAEAAMRNEKARQEKT